MDILLVLISLFIMLAPFIIIVGIWRSDWIFQETRIVMNVFGIKIMSINYDDIKWVRLGSKVPFLKSGWQNWNISRSVTICLTKKRMFSDVVIINPWKKNIFYEKLKTKLKGKQIEFID
ncbi:hypothetical protein ACFL4O_03420 [bacterium]